MQMSQKLGKRNVRYALLGSPEIHTFDIKIHNARLENSQILYINWEHFNRNSQYLFWTHDIDPVFQIFTMMWWIFKQISWICRLMLWIFNYNELHKTLSFSKPILWIQSGAYTPVFGCVLRIWKSSSGARSPHYSDCRVADSAIYFDADGLDLIWTPVDLDRPLPTCTTDLPQKLISPHVI